MKLLLTVFLLALIPSSAPAQSVCWRHTSIHCDGIISTEVGYHGALTNSQRLMTLHYDTTTYRSTEDGGGSDFSWEFAYLARAGKKWMVGPSIQLGADNNGSRFAAKGRARRYINERDSFEFTAGLLHSNFDFGASGNGFTVDARFNVRDYISFMAGYDNSSWPIPTGSGGTTYSAPTKRASAFKVGVNAGSLPAVAATTILTVLFGLLIAGLSGSLN